MKKKSQLSWVIQRLNQYGSVTRNQALRRYISRLGAHICELNKSGWEIKGEHVKTKNGLDYRYRVVRKPV